MLNGKTEMQRHKEAYNRCMERIMDDLFFDILDDLEQKESQPTIWLTSSLGINRVLFKDNATILFWTDGSKSVAKCNPNEMNTYDKKIGIMVAIAKRFVNRKELDFIESMGSNKKKESPSHGFLQELFGKSRKKDSNKHKCNCGCHHNHNHDDEIEDLG